MAEQELTILSTPTHLEGITRLCFSADGNVVFTGGQDCLVRIHQVANPNSEPGFHDQHEEAVTSLTCSATTLVTGCIDNIARTFDYPSDEYTGILVRSNAVPIRSVAFDSKGERVAVCSDDLLVKIVNVNDPTRIQLLSDNSRPVRSATWDPSGRFLTTISCDAKLKIYDTDGDSPVCLKVLDGVIASSEPDAPSVPRAMWHPSGKYFVVPTRTQEIAIFARDTWVKQATFAADGHDSPIGELAWSTNGKYLASAGTGTDRQILIWDAERREIVARHRYLQAQVTGLSFSPKDNLLAFTAQDGTFHRWTDPVPADFSAGIDALADEDLGEELEDEYGDDWIIDDVGGYGEPKGAERDGFVGNQVVSVTKAQPPFTPGSTAMRNKKRYLDFNMVGVIDVTDQETHHVVNVEFHDKSARRGYHFQDHDRFSLASLGERGVIYASRSEPAKPSVISYRAYDAWAAQSDWRITLPQDEDVHLVASGGAVDSGMGAVMVATSKGLVRFFTSSGLQRYVWRMADEMVSLAAGRDLGLMVHREGGTSLDGCQNLRYTVVDLENFDQLQEGRIPLAKKATLVWIGFTGQGAPAMYDSDGVLSVLDRFRRPGQARWVPLLDTRTLARRQGKDESYWPVGVNGSHFTCLILKGKDTEPYFPRPLIQELEVHLPILNYDQSDGQLEEHFVRGELELSTLREQSDPFGETADIIRARQVELDKELLQLVMSACKADKIQRALDITQLMFNTATLEAAIKIAVFYQLPGLKDRIENVLKIRERRRGAERRAQRYVPTRDDSPPLLPPPSERSAAAAAKHLTEFAPRNGGPRRSYGATPTPALQPSRSESYIPETPTETQEDPMDDSPPGKRKRDEREDSVEETPTFEAPKKRTEQAAQPAKNPFARKPAAPSNPFARQATAVPLNSIKSTSFFERVDNIEQHEKVKSNTKAKAKDVPKAKQTTLFGLAPPTGAEKLKKYKMEPPPVERKDTDVESLAATEDGTVATQETQQPFPDMDEETQIETQGTITEEPMEM